MIQPRNITLNWAKIAQVIMALTILLTTVTAGVFLMLFSKGMLVGPYASAAIIMTAVACAIGVASVLSLRSISEKASEPNYSKEPSNRPKTVVTDHTRSYSDDGPKLAIPDSDF